MAQSERPRLTLQNEITNFFGHIVKRDNPDEIKHIPDLIKNMMQELGSLHFLSGRVAGLQEGEAKDEEWEKFRDAHNKKEAELREYYFVEEIVCT